MHLYLSFFFFPFFCHILHNLFKIFGMKYTLKLKILQKLCHEMSKTIYKILPPKVEPWLQNKNMHRKEKTDIFTIVIVAEVVALVVIAVVVVVVVLVVIAVVVVVVVLVVIAVVVVVVVLVVIAVVVVVVVLVVIAVVVLVVVVATVVAVVEVVVLVF